MKLAGILTVGTYYSPWIPYTIASIYQICDFMVIVNGGYDIKNPNKNEYNIPLEKVIKDIASLDIKGKIIEIKGFTVEDIEHKAPLMTQAEASKQGMVQTGAILVWRGNWFDMRGLGLTLANETAVKRGANMILKIDSDQVCYRDVLSFRAETGGLIFHQYEFLGDVFHLAEPPPASPYNDSVFSYLAKRGQYYGGGGAPAIFTEREPTSKYHCAHLRYANPLFSSNHEKFEHFFGRLWFAYYTNEGLWGEELKRRAEHGARELLKRTGKPSNVAPPDVCLLDPISYIEETKKEGDV